MKNRHGQKAYDLVTATKDLETLKKYGLTDDEIYELKGIKKDGAQEKRKIQKDLNEALEEMEMAKRGDKSTSEEEDSTEEIDPEKKKENPYRRRGPRKSRYICKITLPIIGR